MTDIVERIRHGKVRDRQSELVLLQSIREVRANLEAAAGGHARARCAAFHRLSLAEARELCILQTARWLRARPLKEYQRTYDVEAAEIGRLKALRDLNTSKSMRAGRVSFYQKG